MTDHTSKAVVSSESDRAAARTGIAWMLLTTCLFVGQDAIARVLVKDYPAMEVAWARYFVHVLIATVIVAWRNPSLMVSRRPLLQILRSTLLLGSTLTALAAIKVLPFVDYTAIMWVTPVLVTALSVKMLAEKVGWTGWLSVLVGMIGVLVIVRPGGADFSVAMLFPLVAAFTNALYQIITRILKFTDSPTTTFFYTGFAGAILCAPFLPLEGIMPDARGGALMVLLGAVGGASHYCLIRAFTAAPAAVVAPFGYTSLLWATLFSVVVFAEIPTTTTLIGASLIVAAGLVVFLRPRPA